ncbi:threonine aspartase 1 [Aspergillus ruber CBS 135680]|uniref:N-terminal nucleophile aminohydrolase n=1 Tax=Aspergillus ruber (strain CBS 135680) TaxID=1388766 RepID=A0A017SAB7_ASPRC|nr:N-terminal nucleophile aminohydrolase [Aspergillus ruber CBS 135680]EYE93993.1 N-terminal nucleophile aminohydrolase [Aspergillus ruber CBS 135680]
MSRPRKNGDISAIFVHAGAGYHSHHNERSHLEACENAAKAAMAMLKNGGSAVDAVELAIMLLEDSEITNAGYGSNLTLDGKVECDAAIIDHEGRSGAAGAVSHVKNPISLARVILDASSNPLSLHRVPPNFLVGSGATDFAYENRLPVLPHDALIAEGAKQRWKRWSCELRHAEMVGKKKAGSQQNQNNPNDRHIRHPLQYNPGPLITTPSSIATPVTSNPDQANFPGLPPGPIQSHIHNHVSSEASSAQVRQTMDMDAPPGSLIPELRSGDDADDVSDTVGAIAVDSFGNIAAGSSSGGIGMKHPGRVGPAALLGIGTAVIPADPSDPEKAQVATVTSGTGEHIATTMAANTCALRIYYSQRKCPDGLFEEVTEDEALKGSIATDFLGHPGVKRSHCEGAIGIMSVKKTVDGIYLFFGHNTESFALASMNSEDRKPVSVMSRNTKGHGNVAQGGRVCRRKR